MNHNIYQQVNFDGVTGPVRFSQDGKRAGVRLEILNLRNDSFRKVSTMQDQVHSQQVTLKQLTGTVRTESTETK